MKDCYKFEHDLANNSGRLKGKRQPGSGNGDKKLDVVLFDFLIDCKSTSRTQKQDGKSLTITVSMWQEIVHQALLAGKLPAWAGQMECGIEIVAMQRKDFVAFCEELQEARVKLQEVESKCQK